MGNSWRDNFSKKRVSGMLGCIDEGQKVLPVIIFKGMTSFPAAMEDAHESCL